MTTRTEIANRALSAISARATIVNVDLEASSEAKQTRLIYDSTRDALLRSAHWNFAKRTTYLTLLKSAPGTVENPAGGAWNDQTMPAPPWLYEYAYPSDCLLVRHITPPPSTVDAATPPIFSTGFSGPSLVPQTRGTPFEVALSLDNTLQPIKVILSNVRTAVGCYTLRVTSEDLWDASFEEAMVHALGARLALPLTGNVDVQRSISQQALNYINAARVRDGNEGTTQMDHTPDWVQARGYSPGFMQGSFVGAWVTPAFLVA
jgi:hypothetical protein